MQRLNKPNKLFVNMSGGPHCSIFRFVLVLELILIFMVIECICLSVVDDSLGKTGSVLVFCRTPKAASTSATNIMFQLKSIQGFNMYYESNRNNYWPSSNQLMNKLANLPEGTLYVNHC